MSAGFPLLRNDSNPCQAGREIRAAEGLHLQPLLILNHA
jgi:hypothetical protein